MTTDDSSLYAVTADPELAALVAADELDRGSLDEAERYLARAVQTAESVFYQFFSPLPYPPFWCLLGFAIGCGLTLALYERLLRPFSSPATASARGPMVAEVSARFRKKLVPSSWDTEIARAS